MTAHAVCCSGIETVVAEEAAGRIGCQHLTVKEHGHAIGIFGAELHIVGYHDNSDALLFEFT